MAFHLGSLGFLTPFNFENFQTQVTQVIQGESECSRTHKQSEPGLTFSLGFGIFKDVQGNVFQVSETPSPLTEFMG